MTDFFSSPTDQEATRHSPLSLRYATKSELVYQHLRQTIVSGALAPGARVSLDQVARQLGVSTNPVRDALRRLESEGLIANRPHIGATVAAIDVERIETHFQIRGVLEGLAVKLAASHATPAEIDRLASLDRQLDRLAELQDLDGWDACNLSFYRLLFSMSRSLDLVALVDLQRDRSPRYRHFPDVLRQRARETAENRRALLDALRSGDGDAAERLHRANVTRVGELLCAAMRRAAGQTSPVGVTLESDGRREVVP